MKPNDIISYMQMCLREGTSLQRGMNFQLHGRHSVVLMSVRPGAPYEDKWDADQGTLIYEGHDEKRSVDGPDPKSVDQPMTTPGGKLTQNGLFYEAAKATSDGAAAPEKVRVYEKLKQGIWSYAGPFDLMDAWIEQNETRKVFRFLLELSDVDAEETEQVLPGQQHSRLIPTSVKVAVWQRDGGRCQQCGATDELHFDHILPYSKGGTSIKVENVQLLCARHNLKKSDKIL